MTRTAAQRLCLALLASLAWLAIAAQFYWAGQASVARGLPPLPAMLNVLSFFTILSNLIVAVFFTLALLQPAHPRAQWFLAPPAQTAATAYILVVGCVYEVALRRLSSLAGLRLAADITLHYVVPIGTVLYWLFFVPKGTLRYRTVWWWTIYPFAYLAFVTVRGCFTGFYPYPFVNLAALGLAHWLLNVLVLIFVFIAAGLLFVWLDHVLARSSRTRTVHPDAL